MLPVASQDINCPEVTIADGGAALRVGGPDNASVRYQFNIDDTARQCDPAGPSQAALKIGVKGTVVIGPAGSAGTFNAPLKITVTRDRQDGRLFADLPGRSDDGRGEPGLFRRDDPSGANLPMPTLQLADLYSITVGFEGGTGGPTPTGHRAERRGRRVRPLRRNRVPAQVYARQWFHRLCATFRAEASKPVGAR